MTTMRAIVHRVLLSAVLVAGAGCLDDDERCGDWSYVDGSCYPPKDAAVAGWDASFDGLPAGMGDPCTPDVQPCTGEASYCAYNPLTSQGKCSLSNCTASPNNCPTGYECFDVSALAPGYPTVCLTPADIESLTP